VGPHAGYNIGRLLAVKAIAVGWNFMSLFDLRGTLALDLFETSFQQIPRSLAMLQEVRDRRIWRRHAQSLSSSP